MKFFPNFHFDPKNLVFWQVLSNVKNFGILQQLSVDQFRSDAKVSYVECLMGQQAESLEEIMMKINESMSVRPHSPTL